MFRKTVHRLRIPEVITGEPVREPANRLAGIGHRCRCPERRGGGMMRAAWANAGQVPCLNFGVRLQGDAVSAALNLDQFDRVSENVAK